MMDAAAQLYLLGDRDCTAPNYLLLELGLGAGLGCTRAPCSLAPLGLGLTCARARPGGRQSLSCSGVMGVRGALGGGVEWRGASGRLIEGTKAHHSYNISDLGSWDTLNKRPFSTSAPPRVRFKLNIEENFLAVRDKKHLHKSRKCGGRDLEDFLEGE